MNDQNPMHRPWRNLSPEQRTIAAEITKRAEAMWLEADGEITLAEAVTLAAVQIGHTLPAPGDST